ncbi:MAG: hypothetical protein K2N01_06245 [Lachnospiraceae bacterium]|nr:hypothetical protein [Lachnospiraceae bacterium]
MAQNDPIVEVQAKLDQQKSKQSINADLKTLQNQIDPIKLQIKVDPKASSGIKSLLATIKEAFTSLQSMLSGVRLFSELQNIGKRRISVRISNTGYCFEYALHA